MRGFNLFAAFLGTAMILIAIAYSTYMGEQRQERIHKIAEDLVRFDTAGVSAVIKADAYNTILAKIREEFQDFFATNVIDPPETVWRNPAEFTYWFENEFSHSDALAAWIADRMLNELEAYTELDIFGEDYDVYVVGNVKEVTEALKKASKVVINDDGTFTYILNTEDLSKEDYDKLPKLHVRKVGEISGETTDVVIPRGVWRIPVRLRVMDAFSVARAVYEKTKDNIDEIMLATGHCDPEAPQMCGFFHTQMNNGSPEYIVPKIDNPEGFVVRSNEEGQIDVSIISPCQYQSVDFIEFAKGVGLSTVELKDLLIKSLKAEKEILQKELESEKLDEQQKEKIQKRVAEIEADLPVLEGIGSEDELKNFLKKRELDKIPCQADEEILYTVASIQLAKKRDNLLGYLSARYPDLIREDEPNIALLPDMSAYRKYETAKIVRRTAINITKIIGEEAAGILTLVPGLGTLIKKFLQTLAGIAGGTISFDKCQISGSVYCVVPEQKTIIVEWVDPDTKYSVKNEPAVFYFRIRYDKNPTTLAKELQENEEIVEAIEVKRNEKIKDKYENQLTPELASVVEEYVPTQLDACTLNYVRTYLQCSRQNITVTVKNSDGTESMHQLTDQDIDYILTGITEAERGCYEQMKQAYGDDICEKISQGKVYGGTTCPNNQNITYSQICKKMEDYQKDMTPMKGVCSRLRELSIKIPGITQAVPTLDGGTFAYCDAYKDCDWTDPIACVENAADWFEKKLRGLEVVTNALTEQLCNVKENPSSFWDAVKDRAGQYAGWALGLCPAKEIQDQKAYNQIMAKLVEYNALYYNGIKPLLGSRIGMCYENAQSEEAKQLWNSFYETFREPEEKKETIDLGGQCHPKYIGKWLVDLGEQLMGGWLCEFSPPGAEEKYVLFETTWMHIGSEIYSSCSVGEAKP